MTYQTSITCPSPPPTITQFPSLPPTPTLTPLPLQFAIQARPNWIGSDIISLVPYLFASAGYTFFLLALLRLRVNDAREFIWQTLDVQKRECLQTDAPT